MRVIEVTAFGGPEALHVVERARPDGAPGQVLVRVRAANVNPTDLSVRDGSVVQRTPKGRRHPSCPAGTSRARSPPWATA